MNSDVQPVDRDREGAQALEVSALQDEIEILRGRMNGTAGSGLVISALFLVGGAFMERPGTLWFLGALWLFFIARLGLINRNASRELQRKEAEVEALLGPAQAGLLE